MAPHVRSSKPEFVPGQTTRTRMKKIEIDPDADVTADLLQKSFDAQTEELEIYMDHALAGVAAELKSHVEKVVTETHDVSHQMLSRFISDAEAASAERADAEERRDQMIAKSLENRRISQVEITERQAKVDGKLSTLQRGLAALTDKRTVGGGLMALIFVLIHLALK